MNCSVDDAGIPIAAHVSDLDEFSSDRQFAFNGFGPFDDLSNEGLPHLWIKGWYLNTAGGLDHMLTIACCLWDANDLSVHFSRDYDDEWVDKLYRGFARNLTVPFRFVCWTDRDRHFKEPVVSVVNEKMGMAGYGDMIRPFECDDPMILVGLDTVITGNLDHMAEWCLSARQIAMPVHPREPQHCCNGVVLAGKGNRRIFDEWRGENDMIWLRRWPHQTIDSLWPGQVLSWKAHVRDEGLRDARIVYFHGNPKPPALMHEAWVREHWN